MTASVSRPEDLESASAFADSARALLQAVSPLSRLRTFQAATSHFDRTIWRRLAEAGWTSILAPEELGGLGLGLRHACAIAEEVGRHPLPEPFLGAAVQTVSLLVALPAGERRDALLASVMSGELILGTAWQERTGQLEPEESLSTEATWHEHGVKLDGTKRWVTPGTGADGWLVSAASGTDAAIWWVPAASPGLRVVEENRIDGCSSARLSMEAVEVPLSARLATGEDALAALRNANDSARLVQSAELLGIARAAFDMTREYLETRVQFGKPIGANQALQHRMVDAYIQVELAAAGLNEALADVNLSAHRLTAAAGRAKARSVHAALHVTRLGVQLHGAIGFTEECDLGLYLKRALQYASWLGSENAMRLRYHEEAFSLDESAAAAEATGEDDFPCDSDWAPMSEQAFRGMVRRFLRRHYPDHLRHPSYRLHWNECKDWYLTLSRHGWLAPAWPREHGGMGLPGDKLLAFFEEMEDYGVARLPDQGIINLGPVLIRFGTPEQQQEYLPRILSGKHIWCQGYSEPNAGSDLASLRTEAILQGEEFVVNGQKIWTTLAQDATHIFVLVRTDKAAKKQEGIKIGRAHV